MNFRQFKYVITIAECKSFSKAASKLFISQPSLSQYVQTLEKQLGVKLFDRTTTPMNLTPAGKLYVETARQILKLGEQLTSQLSDMATLMEGKITIGASPYRCKYIIPKILQLFQKKYPKVSVMLIEKGRAEVQELLMKGSIDICLTNAPLQEGAFEYHSLITEEVLLALPQGYEIKELYQEKEDRIKSINTTFTINEQRPPTLLQAPSISLQKLKNAPFVLLESDQSLHKTALDICALVGFKPKVVLTNRSFEAALAMVNAGIGITFIPDTLAKYGLYKDNYTYCSIAGLYPTRKVLIAYRKGRYLPKAAFEFINMAKDIFQ